MANYPRGFSEPPFGITVLWGPRKVGKTVAALNSLWLPIHIIDNEFSAKDYEDNFETVKELGLIENEFTRASCLMYQDFMNESSRIIKGDETYGTLILDTTGQITTWLANAHFASVSQSKAEKMSQVVWGEVRDRLRDMLLKLQVKTKLIILTAHEREYANVKSPRANPSILELASLSIRLERRPNQQIPDGIVDVARLPVYPPRIPQFSIAKLLTYHKKPVDWDNLAPDEQVQETVYTDEQEVE
jgi:hypothetical protein